MSQVELRMLSIVAGAYRRWALYAVPGTGEEDVERVECQSRDDLLTLLAKLRSTGVSDSVLNAVRGQIGDYNASYSLGVCDLSQADYDVLGLEPVTGLTRIELDSLTLGERQSQSP